MRLTRLLRRLTGLGDLQDDEAVRQTLHVLLLILATSPQFTPNERGTFSKLAKELE